MPKYFCEYCGIYLTHSSPGGRYQHSHGRKHINNKIEYYSQFLYEFQKNIDSNLLNMTSRLINKTKDNNLQTDANDLIKNNQNEQINENKKAILHITGQMPLTIPLNFMQNVGKTTAEISNNSLNLPVNEKIIKSLPNEIQSQYKLNRSNDDTENKKDENDKNKNNGHVNSKKILENLKKLKYTYNDPNPETNTVSLTDLLKEDDEEEDQKK